jgi:PPOX class probable F420-dependent enzyme
MTLPASARAVVESGRLAHFVTVNADGSPHTTIVWVGLDGDDIVIGKLMEDRKVRNIRRDPRVSLSIEADGDQMGMQFHLVVEGTARITEGGAPELLQALAERYVGPGVRFPPMDDPPPGMVIRVTPERVRGMGPWAS